MKSSSQGYRAHRKRILELLKRPDLDKALKEMPWIPEQQVINPLFSFIHRGDEKMKWAAVRTMGTLVSKLAERDMEAARVVVRRLMWNLNDESGGIGWGSPEAMGEILSRHEGLAKEYAHILLSYARRDGNYLEHEMLQRGLLWGLGRLAEARPHFLKGSTIHLLPFLESADAALRGLSAWLMGLLGAEEARSALKRLTADDAELYVALGGHLKKRTVGELAAEALARLSPVSGRPPHLA